MIRYIKHNNLDKERWDELLKSSANGTVYGYSWYLDAFCEWDALIYKEYEGAIPLPKKPIGPFKKIYQPAFVQTLDWIGPELDPKVKREIWETLIDKADHVHFNSYIDFSRVIGKQRINIELDLSPDYNTLSAAYSKDLRKNLRRAEKYRLQVADGNIDHTIALYKEAYGTLNPQLGDRQYNALKSLVESNVNTDRFVILDIVADDEVFASILFVCGKGRMHYILGAPSQRGRKCNALSVGLDYVIQTYSGSNKILDFEGSSIESVARFFKSFGGSQTSFHEYNVISNPWLKRAHRLLK